MEKKSDYMLLNLPSPPGLDIFRSFAGGFGTAEKVKRNKHGHTNYVLLPSFLLYGASVLRRSGNEFTILDCQALNYDFSKTINEVEKVNPDILISLISLPSLNSDLSLLNEIKKTLPDATIYMLGTVCNVMSHEATSKSSVDFLIPGTYPYYNAILNVARNRRWGFHAEESLDGLLLETYKLLPLSRYICKSQNLDDLELNLFPILIGVGCPYSCIHCPYPVGYGKRIIYKSIRLILDEIEFLRDNFTITDFDFRAQDFTQNKKFVYDLCNGIKERNLKINWIIETRPDLLSRRILEKMREAGCCRINFGIESGNCDTLEKIGRGGITIETMKDAFRMTKDIGFWAHAHIILGIPGENKQTLKDTFDLLCKLNPDSTSWNLMTPYPGTKFFELAEKENWIATKDWSKYTSFDSVINHSNSRELVNTRKIMRYKFRLFRFSYNPSYRKRAVKSLLKRINL